jgi:hypothetical protein
MLFSEREFCPWSVCLCKDAGAGRDWEDNADFAPTKVTEILHNTQFLAAVDLVLELGQLLQGMSAWCEQCPCPGDLQAI